MALTGCFRNAPTEQNVWRKVHSLPSKLLGGSVVFVRNKKAHDAWHRSFHQQQFDPLGVLSHRKGHVSVTYTWDRLKSSFFVIWSPSSPICRCQDSGVECIRIGPRSLAPASFFFHATALKAEVMMKKKKTYTTLPSQTSHSVR